MNKKIATIILVAMLVTMTACGDGNSQSSSQSSTAAAGSQSQNDVSTPVGEKSEKTRLYGKVVSIVGNELELNIGTPDTDIVKERNDELDKLLEEAEDEDKDNGGAIAAIPMTPAMSATSGDFITGGEVESNEPLVPMTYTDENKEITIPVAMPYIDYLNKGRTSFEKIKEGNVLCVEMDGDTISAIYFIS